MLFLFKLLISSFVVFNLSRNDLFINCKNIKYTDEKRMHSDNKFNDINDNNKISNEPTNVLAEEIKSTYWLSSATNFVTQQINKSVNKNKAKNIIYFLGDGLSIPTLAATRAYLGGEERSLSFEQFPSVGMAKTYCLNYQVPDSACTSTAYLSGVKANYNTIGVNGKVTSRNCESILDKSTHTESIAKWALDGGKLAGLITNTRITDASPAGIYAHVSHRNWETDMNVRNDGCDTEQIDDIAKQMIYGDVGKNLRVLLGGGRRSFRNETVRDEENRRGYRTDGRNLIEEWLNIDSANREYVWNTTSLLNINTDETEYLLGLFEDTHMRYYIEVEDENIHDLEPSLTQMTEKALDLLNTHSNDNGFFLFVEGGRIDTGHHGTYARIPLDETAEFSRAIEAAMKKVNLDETLIIVTADHSHTMTFSGYPNRKADVFDVAGISNMDNLPYMALNYATGPGFDNHYSQTDGRLDLNEMDTTAIRYEFPSMIIDSSEVHGGDDVAVFAIGPWSHLFTGVFEQSHIPHMIGYAACIGDGLHVCTT